MCIDLPYYMFFAREVRNPEILESDKLRWQKKTVTQAINQSAQFDVLELQQLQSNISLY